MTDHGSYVELATGAHMPKVGLGTWQQSNTQAGKQGSDAGEVKEAVKHAVKAGYRHIDTAWAYFNEAAIGEALQELFKEGVVKREDLFITTKLFPFFFKADRVEKVLREQLAALQLDYVDMYLVHAPIAFIQDPNDPKNIFPFRDGKLMTDFVEHTETWGAMEAVHKKGLAKAIGVSNYSAKQIQNLIDHGTVKPHNLQVECHAYYPAEELFQFCKKNNIAFTAYSPLGSPGSQGTTVAGVKKEIKILLKEPVVEKIAAKHNKSAGQVLLRFQAQRGMIVIPKSVNPGRIAQNFNIFDFSLDDADMKDMGTLKEGRLLGAAWQAFKDHPQYPFSDE